MNLTNYQASMVVKDAQVRIADAMKKLTEIEPQVKEYHAAYMALKDDYDSTKEKILLDEGLLKWASEQLNNIKTGSQFRTIRSESHLEMKDRERKKYKLKYKWTQFAIDTLLDADRFMTIDRLWEIAIEKLEIPQKAISKLKWGAVNNCWLKSPKLFVYKDGSLGLPEWKDNPGKHYRNAV